MLLRTLVARGASWLDRYDPTWHQRINVRDLRDTNEACVLGQSFGHATEFLDARYALNLSNPNFGLTWRRPFEGLRLMVSAWFFLSHGFTPLRDPESVWQRLWEAEVMKRQVGTSAPVEQELALAASDLAKVRS